METTRPSLLKFHNIKCHISLVMQALITMNKPIFLPKKGFERQSNICQRVRNWLPRIQRDCGNRDGNSLLPEESHTN